MTDVDDSVRLSLGSEELFGKCDDTMELRLPTSLKTLVRERAAERGMSSGAWARLVLATAAMGQEHVISLVADRACVARQVVPTKAGA